MQSLRCMLGPRLKESSNSTRSPCVQRPHSLKGNAAMSVFRHRQTHVGRLEGKAAREAQSDLVGVYGFCFRLLTFPVWIVIFYRNRRKRKREQVEFVDACIRRGINDDRKMAVEWAMAHPDDFPLEEYDPGIEVIQATFKEIIAARKR